MDKEDLKPVIEALIFASDHAITLDRIAKVLEGEDRANIKGALDELVGEYGTSNRGFYIEKVAGGYQFRTIREHSQWIKKLFKTGMQRVSRAAMESLAIIAYKQPVTRGELESIRGVDSGGVLRSLLEKGLIKMVGRKETPGRPVVYGTTKEFLETFDLKDLSELPSLKDLEMMEEGEEGEVGEEVVEEENAPGEASEDNITGGDSVEAQGGGDDSGGQGQGEPQGSGGTRGQG